MNLSDLAQTKGGQLGKRVITIKPEGTLEEALKLMRANDVHHLVVTSSGKVVGLLSPREICDGFQSDTGLTPTVSVSSLMTKDPPILTEKDELSAALHAMRSVGVTGIPVVLKGELQGIITETDLIAILEQLLEGGPTEPTLRTEFETLLANPVIQNAMKLLGDAGI